MSPVLIQTLILVYTNAKGNVDARLENVEESLNIGLYYFYFSNSESFL